ncbi:MAG: twin transmembrane helix small protein [Proteobacteria bacterium]|nr:twin transmembrane helix small protein [Pseudomonadota bacterium]
MPPVVKYVVIAMLIMIVASLGYALYQMATNRQGENDTTMVKALTIRVGLSIALFAILMILSALGIITPNS